MKKNYLLLMLMVFASLGSFAQLGTDVYTLGSDNSNNYGGTWNETSAGTGFSDWTFDTGTPSGGFAGRFTGSFSTELDVSGNSFGLFANSGNGASSGATTIFPKTLQEGDSFQVAVGINFRDGNKGFDLRNSSNGTVINFNVSNDEYNLTGTSGLFSNEYDANTVITFTFTQNATNVSWTASRTGGRTESQSGTVASITPGTITNIRLYNVSAGSNDDGGGARNFFFNSLQFQSLYSINNTSSVTISSTATVPYLSIETGSSVTINSGIGLTISGDLDNNGTLTANSGSSLIVGGGSTGNVTYNRNLATTNWYFLSSPLADQSIVDFYTNESPELGSGTGNAQNVAIASYDNSQADVNNRYAYYTEGQVDGLDGDDTADTFMPARGYTVKLNTAKTVSFTGTVRTSNTGVPFTLAQGGAMGTNYNLLGNPYLAFINSTTFLNAESTNLEATFWIWNGSSYDTRTTGTSPNFQIAPGQAFFAEAKTTGTVTFTKGNQSHVTSDTFQKTVNTRPEITVNITDGTKNRKAELFYIDGTTTGFDNGFDGKMFDGVPNSLGIFSQLVSNDNGVKYAIQSLPNTDLESMVIPVGIIADANKEITFSANVANLPSGIKVFLEDRTTNTFTRLDELNSTYKVTLNEKTNDIGRFYLHTKSAALSTETVVLENVSIYSADKATLRIVGLSQGKSTIKMFNVLGKQVLNSTFNSNGVSEINVSQLSTGVYIVQLANEAGTLNKKIVLE
ncbi:T9SS type A sorting domain-containing protein [Polaribacter sp. Hel_I_88]|uniref:T9SS type A sorting domain-containing protein n=1 Tax=Polaribacter sp. Hel_I_88 TaxID=1250006 RepID=UPI00047E1B61|nr:T9SS type A sorting domain-containing protein [Polaribacter sp. Hel_I_88]